MRRLVAEDQARAALDVDAEAAILAFAVFPSELTRRELLDAAPRSRVALFVVLVDIASAYVYPEAFHIRNVRPVIERSRRTLRDVPEAMACADHIDDLAALGNVADGTHANCDACACPRVPRVGALCRAP